MVYCRSTQFSRYLSLPSLMYNYHARHGCRDVVSKSLAIKELPITMSLVSLIFFFSFQNSQMWRTLAHRPGPYYIYISGEYIFQKKKTRTDNFGSGWNSDFGLQTKITDRLYPIIKTSLSKRCPLLNTILMKYVTCIIEDYCLELGLNCKVKSNVDSWN